MRLPTTLTHLGRPGTRAHGFVNTPVHRGSTILFEDMAQRLASQAPGLTLKQTLLYGLEGGPTHFALEDMLAAIEGGTRAQIVSSGLAAVTTALLAFLRAGDHLLMVDSVYGPSRNFATRMLKHLGIETEFYRPALDEAGLASLIRPNTRVVFLESPGSHTFEMQDVAGLARAAHAGGARVLLDNTWGLRFFQPFTHGVDVSIQALTKYVGGHSDIMLGGITVANDSDWETVRTTALTLGQFASPDDCWLALRGARTLAVRLDAQWRAGLAVAEWFATRPEVLRVLHPALPGAPGHDLWQRDYTGACSLFAVVFQPSFTQAQVAAFVDKLTLFGIGASWGGYESLALPTPAYVKRMQGAPPLGGPGVRFHIGLEDVADLLADIEQAMAALHASS